MFAASWTWKVRSHPRESLLTVSDVRNCAINSDLLYTTWNEFVLELHGTVKDKHACSCISKCRNVSKVHVPNMFVRFNVTRANRLCPKAEHPRWYLVAIERHENFLTLPEFRLFVAQIYVILLIFRLLWGIFVNFTHFLRLLTRFRLFHSHLFPCLYTMT